MTNIDTTQPWQARELNQSGVRRLKMVNAASVSVINGDIVPQGNALFSEFIFSEKLPCLLTIESLVSEAGNAYWRQTISFTLPHFSTELALWMSDNKDNLWIVIIEDYNGQVRLCGGSFEGMRLGFQATTGATRGDSNPQAFSLSADQLVPFVRLDSYDNTVLFSNTEFDFGFDFSFN